MDPGQFPSSLLRPFEGKQVDWRRRVVQVPSRNTGVDEFYLESPSKSRIAYVTALQVTLNSEHVSGVLPALEALEASRKANGEEALQLAVLEMTYVGKQQHLQLVRTKRSDSGKRCKLSLVDPSKEGKGKEATSQKGTRKGDKGEDDMRAPKRVVESNTGPLLSRRKRAGGALRRVRVAASLPPPKNSETRYEFLNIAKQLGHGAPELSAADHTVLLVDGPVMLGIVERSPAHASDGSPTLTLHCECDAGADAASYVQCGEVDERLPGLALSHGITSVVYHSRRAHGAAKATTDAFAEQSPLKCTVDELTVPAQLPRAPTANQVDPASATVPRHSDLYTTTVPPPPDPHPATTTPPVAHGATKATAASPVDLASSPMGLWCSFMDQFACCSDCLLGLWLPCFQLSVMADSPRHSDRDIATAPQHSVPDITAAPPPSDPHPATTTPPVAVTAEFGCRTETERTCSLGTSPTSDGSGCAREAAGTDPSAPPTQAAMPEHWVVFTGVHWSEQAANESAVKWLKTPISPSTAEGFAPTDAES